MALTVRAALYGLPPEGVIETPADAVQLSPLVPGSTDLSSLDDTSLSNIAILAPPGTIERRAVLADALRALSPGGQLVAAAPADRGGRRLRKELEAFGCAVGEDARRHHRVCTVLRPPALTGLAEAIAEGAPRQFPDTAMWTQPGVFSWDRLDPASALLMETLPPLKGAGADFGAGLGWLALAVLASPKVTDLLLIDLDRRAVDAARRNIADTRARIVQADIRHMPADIADLDFVVMNPPFHDGGEEDRSLGQTFIRNAARALRRGGHLWLTANRHLPYEAVLRAAFSTVTLRADAGGYKIYEAQK